MADWDKADMLVRLRIETGRPATDQDLTDVKAYYFLSQAQREVYVVMASRIPWVLYTGVTLTTADNKLWVESGGEWLGEITVFRDNTRKGQPLGIGAEWDAGAFAAREGVAGLRLTVGRATTTAPFVLRVNVPTKIDATTDPTLLPQEARQALVYHAAGQWAKTGGYRDPAPYFAAYNNFLFGDTATGEPGFLNQYLKQRRTGVGRGAGWWYGMNGSVGY